MELFPAIDLRGAGPSGSSQGDFDRRDATTATRVDLAPSLRRRRCAGGSTWSTSTAARTGDAGEPRRWSLAIASAVGVGRADRRWGAHAGRRRRAARRRSGARRARHGGRRATLIWSTPGPARTRAGRGRARPPGCAAAEVAGARGGRRRSGRHSADALDRSGRRTPWPPWWSPPSRRDGMMAGPDLEGCGRALARRRMTVIASGGVASPDDLVALAASRRRTGGAWPAPSSARPWSKGP